MLAAQVLSVSEKRELIEAMGVKEAIEAIGVDEIIQIIGIERIIEVLSGKFKLSEEDKKALQAFLNKNQAK